jgi:CHAT domain-containing protein
MEIIDRENQLSLAEDLIRSVSNSWKPEKIIIEFTGLMGSGKSILLRKIKEIAFEYPIQTIFVDFGGALFHFQDAVNIKLVLLQSILDQFNLDLYAISSLSNVLRKCLVDRNETDIDQLAIALVHTVKSLKTTNNTVFIFDSVDRIGPDLISWLETKIFIPLLEESSNSIFGFFIGCRYSIKWGNYQMRSFVESDVLEPFSKENTVNQIKNFVEPEIAEKLHTLTNGFPSFNDFVAQRTQEELRNREMSEEEFQVFEARLTRDLVSTIIEKNIVKAAGIDFQIIQYLCVSTLFDEDIVKKILEEFFKNTPRTTRWVNRFIQNRLLAINEESIQLASWESAGYVINPIVRKTLSLDLRLNKTDIYEEITTYVIVLMRERLETNSHPEAFILETVLQLANLLSLKSRDFVNDVGNELSKLIVERCRNKPNGVYIARDIKSQLLKLEDLKLRLGKDITRIIAIVDDFIAEEMSNQEKATQVVNLTIQREPSQKENDVYYLSLDIPGMSRNKKERLDVPKVIRSTILGKMQGVLSLELIEEIGKNIFGNYLPQHWRNMIFRAKHPIKICSDDNELPWEYLYDAKSFLCKTHSVSRIMSGFDEVDENEGDANTTRSSQPKGILLIANPTDDDNLRESEIEVEEIAKFAQRAGLLPDVLIGPSANIYNVSTSLNSGKYRIIHYSGHAYFDEMESYKSGLLLNDGRLSASNILNNIKGSPFVFLNACFTAKVDNVDVQGWRQGPQSWGIASAFVQKGAAGCIGGLWRISDEASRKFATSFYQSAFLGLPVGLALRDARNIFDVQSLDWASYVMYCDPLYKFVSQI